MIDYLENFKDDESVSAEVNVSNENEKQNTANENKFSECRFVVIYKSL